MSAAEGAPEPQHGLKVGERNAEGAYRKRRPVERGAGHRGAEGEDQEGPERAEDERHEELQLHELAPV